MIAQFLTGSAAGRAFTFGIIALIIYTPYCLAIGIKKMSYGKKVPASDYWKCWIPFLNIYIADKEYWGKAWLATYSLLGLLGLPIRIIAVFMTTEVAIVYYITIGLMFAGFVFWYIANLINSYTIIQDAQIMSKFKAILLSLFFPIGYMYISGILSAEVNRKAAKIDSRKGF